MTPIDPATLASADPRSPMAPPYVDENPNLDSVREGMRVAEDERRNLIVENYQDTALESDDPSEALDGVDRTLIEGNGMVAELEALHMEDYPEN